MRRRKPGTTSESVKEVVLFATCYGNYNYPEVPRAAVRVLERQGYSVVFPEGQSCCGMPNLDGGDVDAAVRKMKHDVALLEPYARRGVPIVVPGPTCGYTIKKEWPVYEGSADAGVVAKSTFDLMEFLDKLRQKKELDEKFSRGLGKIAYHAACHLRAQKVAIPGARVLSRVPDTEVRVIERCSAVDGTWGMKAKHYEEGAKYAKKLVREIEAEPADQVVGDCSLAGLRVLKETGSPMKHPIVALAEAYGIDPGE
jgi:glycerol-3-phosphate dehydrogenase subunit C